jgi:hypothetical protein
VSSDKTPVLVVRGGTKQRLELAAAAALWGTALFLGGTYFLATRGYLPSLSTLSGWRPHPAVEIFLRHGALLLGGGAAWVTARILMPTLGRVEFHEDVIVFWKPATRSWNSSVMSAAPDVRSTIRWKDVTGFRDDASDHVAVVCRSGTSSFLTIPTPSEQDRVAVLDLLVKRGVPREEPG